MSPGEQRLLQFIVTRMDSMLRRPSAWGSLRSVEEQILQLLEMRRALLEPSTSPTDTRSFMQAYEHFIAQELEHSTPEPLSTQLEARGRSGEFSALMRKFVQEDLVRFVAEARATGSGDASAVSSKDFESARTILEILRLEAEANAGHGAAPPTRPINFPAEKHN